MGGEEAGQGGQPLGQVRLQRSLAALHVGSVTQQLLDCTREKTSKVRTALLGPLAIAAAGLSCNQQQNAKRVSTHYIASCSEVHAILQSMTIDDSPTGLCLAY